MSVSGVIDSCEILRAFGASLLLVELGLVGLVTFRIRGRKR